MKLAKNIGGIPRLRPSVLFFAIMMTMAMPAFAEEIALPARAIQISPEISLSLSEINGSILTYKGKDGLVVSIKTGVSDAQVDWLEVKTNASSRYTRSENRLVVAVGTSEARLTTIRVPKKKKGTMNAQAEMPVRAEKEVVLNKMAGHFLSSVLARLEEAVRSGKLETAPESADMLVLKRDIQALMTQPLATVYRTPRKKKLASNSGE